MKEKNIIKKLLNELKKNEINYPLAIVGSAVNNSKFNDLDFLMAVDDINIVKKKIKTAFNIYKVNFVDDAIKIEDYTNFEISIALYQKNKINSLVYDFLSGKSICCQHRIWCLGYWLPESFIENLKQM